MNPLSIREQIVLGLIGAGETEQDIAQRLDCSVSAIQSVTRAIRRKLNAHNNAALILAALRVGLASSTPSGPVAIGTEMLLSLANRGDTPPRNIGKSPDIAA